jgi:hypothetical protein
MMRVEKKQAAHGNARPGMQPETCGLRAQTIEHGCDGDSMVCRRHLGSGLCALRNDGFAFGVPAAVEGFEVGLLTCVFMSRPLVSELLVPAPGLAGTANADMGSPYGGMSVSVHCHLLPAC